MKLTVPEVHVYARILIFILGQPNKIIFGLKYEYLVEGGKLIECVEPKKTIIHQLFTNAEEKTTDSRNMRSTKKYST